MSRYLTVEIFVCKFFSLPLHDFMKPCSICKFNVLFSLSPHFFSTRSESPAVYDLLVNKHHFSPQVASSVASDLTRSRSPEKADSILSFLTESGFSSTQLEKLVKCKPRILTAPFEDEIRSKFKIFRESGLSPEDIAHITSSNQVILQLSAKNRIVPSLSLLQSFLGSESDHQDVARLLKKCPWFLTVDLGKILMPNVEILKGYGVALADIRRILFCFPRFMLVRPEIMRKSAEKAEEMGASRSSRMFIYGVRSFASMSDEAWQRKLRAMREMGFSDGDLAAMFGKAPMVFLVGVKKIRKVKQLLVATGKFDTSSIVDHPCLLGCSIERRLKPRLRILGILERKKLIGKWPSLGTIYTMSNPNFLDRFVWRYSEKVGKAFETMAYIKGIRK
ncbi:uncharacterized protein LOC131010888 [Salvia miltiorrhiza]|uniref:uncharacterized protein LOC131010888 n=1 Tax=Salvia miltiorrhiza TaxID=226208 RepID=UPI0025AC408F|nr:uncharacterized protein LOC131010888 [Salvia miltiorrhiza]